MGRTRPADALTLPESLKCPPRPCHPSPRSEALGPTLRLSSLLVALHMSSQVREIQNVISRKTPADVTTNKPSGEPLEWEGGAGGAAPSYPAHTASSASALLLQQLVPFPRCPGPGLQDSFLSLRTNCVPGRRKLLSHCWAGGGWHSGRLSQERISNQAAGSSEPCAQASGEHTWRALGT